MWKITPVLLAATGNSGRRRAATTAVSSSPAAPLPGMTPYRFFCAVQRADPILQRKSPPGRVAVLINRFKRLTPQARGGLKRMLLTIKGVPPRKRADKYKELVLSRRRYEGFSVKKQQQSTGKSTSASSSSPAVKKKSAASKSNKKPSSASSTTSTASSSPSIAKGKRLARLQGMKTRANRMIIVKRRRQASTSKRGAGKASSSSSSTKIKKQQPAASAPFADHMSFLLHRIRSNKIGPRDAAKLINELRRKFNKC